MKLDLSHEEIDAICTALNEVQNTSVHDDAKRVFEKLRKKIREKVPNSASIEKLIDEL